MPRWLPRVLTRVHELAAQQKVRFTLKARRELAGLGLGLDHQDAVEVLANLTAEDSAGRLISERTGEWMYVFRPRIAGMVVYVKLVLRTECVVVSFHEEGDDHDLEDEA